MKARLTEDWAAFLLALQFMTRLPVQADWSENRAAAAPRWYPAAGLVIGVMAAVVFWVSALVFPPLLATLLAVSAVVVLTGALHEDGFADCCDALGGSAPRERALEIMRDSRIGTYGALGLGLLIAIKVSALASLPTALVPVLLIAAHAASRAACTVVIATGRYVRDEGAGKPVANATDSLIPALSVAALAFIALGIEGGERALLGGLLGLILAYLVTRRWFERRLGGYTGDCLGALQQTSETGLYLGALAALSLP